MQVAARRRPAVRFFNEYASATPASLSKVAGNVSNLAAGQSVDASSFTSETFAMAPDVNETCSLVRPSTGG